MRTTAAGILIFLGTLAVACGGGGDKADASVTLLGPAEYQAAIVGEDVFVVNLHIPYEGEVAETDAFIPFDEVAQRASELPSDKSAPLYIYCRTGRMSAEATPVLQRMGYTNIFDLRGGMVAWEQAGLPLLLRQSGR